jgi:hypothetical protein
VPRQPAARARWLPRKGDVALKGNVERQPSADKPLEGFVMSKEHDDFRLPVHSLYIGSRDGQPFPVTDRGVVTSTVASSYDCFTIIDADGYFQGSSVATLVIKIATEDEGPVIELGHKLGLLLDQKSVGLESLGYFKSISMV